MDSKRIVMVSYVQIALLDTCYQVIFKIDSPLL